MLIQEKHAIEIRPMEKSYLPEMAQMVAARVKRQRKAVTMLDNRLESPEALLPQLEALFQYGSGRVALENGILAGFMAGWLIPAFMGTQNGVFVPEVGFGADSVDPARTIRLFRALYAETCRVWCAAGWVNHAFCTYQEERAFRDFLVYQGFGGVCFDCVRPALPLNLPIPRELRIREVDPGAAGTMQAWLELANLHTRYMRSAPICLGSADERIEESELADWLGKEHHCAWVAEPASGGQAIAYLQIEPETEGTSMLVHEPGNLAVTGAFTRPEARGEGVATLLLDAALKKAEQLGMTRVSVDFETRNTPAMSFWTRHFTPFTYSLLRCVDERAVVRELAD